jgi:hypothetical protein
MADTVNVNTMRLAEQVSTLLSLYTVKQVLEMLSAECRGKADGAKLQHDRDMMREWQHTAMWINSIVGKVTV